MPGVGRVSVELHPEKGKLFIVRIALVRTALVRTFLRKSEKSNDLICPLSKDTWVYSILRVNKSNKVSVQ